jgi:hypothetical protein
MHIDSEPDGRQTYPLNRAALNVGASSKRVRVFICSALAGVFSLTCLAFGFDCLRSGLTRQTGYPTEAIARGCGFIFVGAFCVWIAIRWARAARKLSSGR